MKKRKIILLVFFIIFITGILRNLHFDNLLNFISDAKNYENKFSESTSYREIENISSQNAILIDVKHREIVMGKNPRQRINPASMTKVMTAIVAIENTKNFNERVEINSDIISYCIKNDLSVSGFEANDRPKIKDLLYGVMLESGGESSIALANHISGSIDGFVELMNEKAREIGLENTHFSTPVGETRVDNYSTVEDIGKLFDYGLKNKLFKKIIDTSSYTAKNLNGSRTNTISNSLFHKRAVLNIKKDYILGGKTGYTEAAGLCLVSYGKADGNEYITVTAGAKGNIETTQYNLLDTQNIYKELEQ